MTRLSYLIAAVVACSAWTSSASAQMLIALAEVGPDVTMTLSGNANTDGLTLDGSFPGIFGGALVDAGNPSAAYVTLGQSAGVYTGITGPSSFGPGLGSPFTTPTSSGDMAGLLANTGIILPDAYVSGAALSASATFAGQTVASLGLTPGTYTWTWGGGDVSTGQALQIVVPAAIPEPGPIALAAVAGVGILGARRLRRLG